uniref:Uncharacterized protein n=1 Tax=Mustela putorius furo TaxID=9669 RepID=M3Z7H5_MUSPF
VTRASLWVWAPIWPLVTALAPSPAEQDGRGLPLRTAGSPFSLIVFFGQREYSRLQPLLHHGGAPLLQDGLGARPPPPGPSFSKADLLQPEPAVQEAALLALLLVIFLLLLFLLLLVLVLLASPRPIPHLPPFPCGPPLHWCLLLLLGGPAAPTETPTAPAAATATPLFSLRFKATGCGALEAQQAEQGTGQLPGCLQAKLAAAQPPVQVRLQDLAHVLEELAGDQQSGQHLGAGRGRREATWGAGRARGTGGRLRGLGSRPPGASCQTHAPNPTAASTPFNGVPGHGGPSSNLCSLSHQLEPGRPQCSKPSSWGCNARFHPAGDQGPPAWSTAQELSWGPGPRGTPAIRTPSAEPAPWNMHPWLRQRKAPSTATLPALARPHGLAICPYFGPGHEQEAPEGEEEQAEPQGRERDQHRPKLPLEALGQGQDEQELWRDRRTGGQTDGGRQAERGHMDERTEREGWRRGGRGWRARGPLGWTSPAPLGRHCGGGHCLGLGSHLFQALHVLEVEADVEEAQVGVDKLELWEGSRRAVPLPPPNPGAPPIPHAEPSLPACWLPLTRTTLIMRCFS